MQSSQIFPTTITVTKASKHDEIKKYLQNNVYPKFEEVGYNSNQCNVFSDYFPEAPLLDQQLFSEFYRTEINDLLTHYNYNSNINWNIHNYFWYNITGKNGWQETHNHLTGPLSVQYSAIHYVEFDQNVHTAVQFKHPCFDQIRSILPGQQKNLPPEFKNLIMEPTFLQEGDIIFFPSYLNHLVGMQKTDQRRVSIAMNISINSEGF